MMEIGITQIIVTVVPAVLTYFAATTRSKIARDRLFTKVQSDMMEHIQKVEENIRVEIWRELKAVKDENILLRKEVEEQRIQIIELRKELEGCFNVRGVLEKLVESYKKRIEDLEKK